VGRRKTRLCLPYAPSARRHEILTTRGLRDGNRKRRRAFYNARETSFYNAGETSIEYAV